MTVDAVTAQHTVSGLRAAAGPDCVGDLALALDVSEDSDDFPAPLRDHCLRQLIALSHTTDDIDSSPTRDEER
ncbi:MAG: hypothetical protein M3070_10325 [Actinomycetota bacterium]|nr:hypothetical protein [Actinomycetota bacterium]